jgi:hypothetical protein
MKRRSVRVSLLFALLALGGAVPLLAALRAHVTGTFRGTVHRTQTSTNPPMWNVTVTGTTQLAGLGVGDMVMVYNDIGLSPSGNSLVGGISGGTGTFTAHNGDKIVGTFNFLTAATEGPNVLSLVGNVLVNGGTGIFTNISGSGIAVGQGNTQSNEVTLSIDGFFDSPTLSPPSERNRLPGIR